MQYVVVENRKGYGWTEHLTCSREDDAQNMVKELYKEAQKRGENREYKYITLPGDVVVPEEKPRQSKEARMEEKISKLFGV